MTPEPSSKRATLLVAVILASSILAFLPTSTVSAAGDSVTLLETNLVDQVSMVADGEEVVIKAIDGITSTNTSWAIVTDLTNADFINVTLYDDGTNSDDTADDGIYFGKFKVVNDNNASGAYTNNLTDTLDLAHGESAEVVVNLDDDSSKGSATVSTDFHTPQIDIHVSSGSYYNESMTLSVTVDDDHLNQSSVMYAMDNDIFSMFPSMLPTPMDFEVIIDVSSVAEGEHFFRVTASDEVGNTEEVRSLPFFVDHTPPEIFDLDLEGALLSGFLFLNVTMLSGNGAPLSSNSVTYSIDGGIPVPFVEVAPGVFQAIIDMETIGDGPHTLEINYADTAGNTNSELYHFIVDTKPPKVTTTELDYDQYYTFTFETYIDDEHLNESLYFFFFNNNSYTPVNVSINGTRLMAQIELEDMLLDEADNIFQVQATDLVGNMIVYNLTIRLIEHPGPCSTCTATYQPNGNVTLTWTGPGGTIEGFRVYHSTDELTNIQDITDYETIGPDTLDVPNLPPGRHYFAVTAVFNGVEGPPCFLFVDVPEILIADISLSRPEADPSDPTEGDEIKVYANLTNKGKAFSNLTVKLFVDGNEEASQDVDVLGDGEEAISLLYPQAVAGAHRLEVRVYQRGSNVAFITEAVHPNPLYVKKIQDAEGGSWLMDLVEGTVLEPPVRRARDSAGSDIFCCVLGLIILVIIVGVAYAIYATRKRRDPDDELARALERERTTQEPIGQKSYPTRTEVGASKAGAATRTTAVTAHVRPPVKPEPAPPTTPPPPTPQHSGIGAQGPAVIPAPVPMRTTETQPHPEQVYDQGPPIEVTQPVPPPPEAAPPEPITTQEQPPAPAEATTVVTTAAVAPAPVTATTSETTEVATRLREKIEELQAKARSATMESTTAVSRVYSAATKDEADAAAGKVLLIKSRVEGALSELEAIAEEATAAALGAEVEKARASLTRSIEMIKERAEKALKASAEKTG